jgi:hypothetical protein
MHPLSKGSACYRLKRSPGAFARRLKLPAGGSIHINPSEAQS